MSEYLTPEILKRFGTYSDDDLAELNALRERFERGEELSLEASVRLFNFIFLTSTRYSSENWPTGIAFSGGLSERMKKFVWGYYGAAYDNEPRESRKLFGYRFTKSLDIGLEDMPELVRLNPGMRIADVGCGGGEHAYAVANEFDAEVVGIEPNCVNVRKFYERLIHEKFDKPNLKIEISTVQQSKIPRGSQDIAFLGSTTRLADDESTEEILRSSFELLRPGGRLILLPSNPYDLHKALQNSGPHHLSYRGGLVGGFSVSIAEKAEAKS